MTNAYIMKVEQDIIDAISVFGSAPADQFPDTAPDLLGTLGVNLHVFERLVEKRRAEIMEGE